MSELQPTDFSARKLPTPNPLAILVVLAVAYVLYHFGLWVQDVLW